MAMSLWGHRCRAGSRSGRWVATQALVRSGHVVVLLDELPQQPLQVLLVEHDDMAEQLAPERADGAFDVWGPPGALKRCPYLTGAAALQEQRDSVTVDPLVVAEEALRLRSEGHRVPELLDHPLHRWIARGREVDHPSPSMLEHQEHVDRREVDRPDREEVDRPRHVEVVSQERGPRRRRLLGPPVLHHVLSDRVVARRVVTEKQQRVSDPLGRPERVLAAELTNQNLHFRRDGWSSTLP